MIKAILCFLVLTICMQVSSYGQTSHATPVAVGEQQAEALLREALRESAPKAVIEHFADASEPGFLMFVAAFANETAGSPIIGYFAVNSQTGDIWNTAGPCHLITSPGLDRMQRQIRLRSKLTEQAYKTLRAKKPDCDAEPDTVNAGAAPSTGSPGKVEIRMLDGRVLQGTFLGGTTRTIQLRIDGRVEGISISQIEKITFSAEH